MSRFSHLLGFPQRVLRDFIDDECPARAAALAYYAVFAFPAVVTLLIVIAGTVWDSADVERAMSSQLGVLVGDDVGNTLRGVLQRAERPGNEGIVATIVSIVMLLVGATGALGQLQAALNNAWEVRPDPRQGGVRRFIVKRLLSALMILGLGLLLLVSLMLSAALSALSEIATFVPEGTFQLADITISFAILSVTFAGIYKFLPDAQVGWRDVWLGATVTTAILVGGKFAIGLYLGRSAPGSAYGAAGALAAVLVWSYFAAMTVLLGAEATQAWVQRYGREMRPQPGAIRVPRIVRQELEQPTGRGSAKNDRTPPRVAPPSRPAREVRPGSARHFVKSVRRYPRGARIAAAGIGWWLLRRWR